MPVLYGLIFVTPDYFSSQPGTVNAPKMVALQSLALKAWAISSRSYIKYVVHKICFGVLSFGCDSSLNGEQWVSAY